jgi:hypothetical protein
VVTRKQIRHRLALGIRNSVSFSAARRADFEFKATNWLLSREFGAKVYASTATGREKPVEVVRIKETLASPHLWSP